MCKYYFFIFIIFFFLTLIGQRISDLFEAEAESARRNDVYGLRGLAEGPLLFFAHKSPGKSIFFVFFKISSSADWLLAKALAALANPAFFFFERLNRGSKNVDFLKKKFFGSHRKKCSQHQQSWPPKPGCNLQWLRLLAS